MQIRKLALLTLPLLAGGHLLAQGYDLTSPTEILDSAPQVQTAPAPSVPAQTYEPVSQAVPAPQTVHAEPAPGRVVRARRVKTAEDQIARLQIYLDQQGFGPGKIDGGAGEFTAKALLRYRKAKGLPLRTDPAILDDLPLDKIDPIYTRHEITEDDMRHIGTVPKEPKDQAKLKRMPYSSLARFLSERYHSDPNFIQKLNPQLNLHQLQVGDSVRVPNVKPFRIEDVKAIAKMPAVEAFKTRRIEVDTQEKMLDLYEGEQLLASFPITPGSSKLPAPPGKWRIVGIATLPWFRWDEGVLKRGVRTDTFYNIPAGPSNPVGVVWIGLNRRSIGLHGTNNPDTIGRATSHGCIRLSNWDAFRLVNLISPGISVVIDRDKIAAPKQEIKVSENQTLTSPR